jgi:hypothetical protein
MRINFAIALKSINGLPEHAAERIIRQRNSLSHESHSGIGVLPNAQVSCERATGLQESGKIHISPLNDNQPFDLTTRLGQKKWIVTRLCNHGNITRRNRFGTF